MCRHGDVTEKLCQVLEKCVDMELSGEITGEFIGNSQVELGNTAGRRYLFCLFCNRKDRSQ